MRALSFVILSIVLSLGVGLASNLVTGVALGLGLLLGFAGSVLVVPALRAAPAGLKGAATDDAESGWAEFQRELARARRFDRPFATIRVPLGEPIDEGRLITIRNALAANARRIDRIWIDEADLLVLLPETSRVAAVAVMDRIAALLPEMENRPTLAVFPEQGITSGSLIAAVYAQQGSEVPTTIGTVRPELALEVADPMDELAAQSG